jgi:hypothetical protein
LSHDSYAALVAARFLRAVLLEATLVVRLKLCRQTADLLQVGIIVPDLCDLSRYPLQQALRIARQRCTERTSYDLQIFQFLNQYLSFSDIDLLVVERAVDILCEIAPTPRLLSILRSAMENNDPQIRSKSALLLINKIESPSLLQKLITDSDARVRANAIEALWGRQTVAAEEVFRKGLLDLHHRVAANAVYGLLLIDPEKYRANLEVLANHTEPNRRGGAAWIIGKIGDIRNAGLLKPLLVDANAAVRGGAFRAIRALRSATMPKVA